MVLYLDEIVMAGFLDPKERIVDLVLTDIGKSLFLKGDLHFTYWIPFDDEVDYDPPIIGEWVSPAQFVPSASMEPDDAKALRTRLTEDPLVREASMGYRGLNYVQVDTTNVQRPMYSAPPGVGQTYPLLEASASSGSLSVQINQTKQSKLYVQFDDRGQTIVRTIGPGEVAFKRESQSESYLTVDYPLNLNELPKDIKLDGFLVTMYHSSALKKDELGQDVGGYDEILQNRDSTNSIVYRNDLALDNFTP